MKTIILLAATVVAGAVRYPSEGAIVVRSDEEADALVENGSAEFLDDEDTLADDLDDLTVDKLKAVAADEKVDLGDATKKADLIAAIRAHRAA